MKHKDFTQLHYMYLTICFKIRLNKITYPEFNVHIGQLTSDDIKIMTALLDIEIILYDIGIPSNWFDKAIDNYPFEGLTPLKYLQKHGKIGLFETKLYVSALRHDYLFTMKQ